MSEFSTLLSDLVLVESPRWHDDRLLFSDWGAGEILSVDLVGHREVIARVTSIPFCLDRTPDGRLLVVSGTQLLVRDESGSLVVYAELNAVAELAWNDIVVDGRGNAYVNNIGFEFPGGEFKPGIVALVTPDGTVRQVADGLAFPNGMAVTADDTTLIVAESYGSRLTAFDIEADGTLSNRRVWAELDSAAPDGICVDADGAVWFAEVPGKRCVRVREGGEVLQVLPADIGCFACTLGGPERTILFVVGAEWPAAMTPGSRTGRVLTAEVAVPGAGWPG